MKTIYVISILLLVLLIDRPTSAQQRKTAAVLEFVSADLAKSEVVNLTNRFRTSLSQTQAFDLIERAAMQEILKEQDFTMSDQCNATECAVQIGKLLGAEIMVAGDVGKLGNTYTIDLRLIDVTTGKILQAKQQDYKGDIDGLLSVMQVIASDFAGLRKDKTSANTTVIKSSTEAFGTAVISLNVEGAIPEIDGVAGNPVFSKTVRLNLTAGIHRIKFTKSGFLASQDLSLMIKENEDTPQTIELKEDKAAVGGMDLSLNYGIVSLSSIPAGARVLDGDVEVGTTPLSGLKLSVGSHTLVLRKAKYYPQSVTVDIKDGLNRVPEKTLAPNFGTLKISSVPAGAKVRINGQWKQGATPLTLDEFQSGSYEVEVEKDRYFAEKRTVEVTDLKLSEQMFTMKPQFADVTITSNPSGAKVYLDNQYLGETPLVRKGETDGILAGKYALRLTMGSDLYLDYEDVITVRAGEPVQKTVDIKSHFGTIKIATDAVDFKSLINGLENRQLSSNLQVRLKPGTYDIELTKNKHHPVKKTVTVTDGALETIKADFVPMQGRVVAYSVPDGAEFTLTDEKGQEIYNGKTLDRQVLIGTYTIKSRMDGYERVKEKTVQVTEGYKEPIEISFTEQDRHRAANQHRDEYNRPTSTLSAKLGGPSNAYLSVLIPGLGGYFVDQNKTRAAFTTIAAGGLMVFGILQKSEANRLYDDYKSSTDRDELSYLYDRANSANHRYYIATRVSAAIWIADIIYVAIKGARNQRTQMAEARRDGFKFHLADRRVLVGYDVAF